LHKHLKVKVTLSRKFKWQFWYEVK